MDAVFQRAAAYRPLPVEQVSGGAFQQPSSPATVRPSSPATVRPRNPVTEQPGGRASHQLGICSAVETRTRPPN